MSDMERIVRESVETVSKNHYNQSHVTERLNELKGTDEDVDLNRLLEFLIEYSTGYSNTVLAETLENLQKEGYLKS